MKIPQDSDTESNKDLNVKHSMTDNADKAHVEKEEDLVEEKESMQQVKHHSQSNVIAVGDTSKQSEVKKRMYKRHSHSNIVATGNLIDSIDDVQMLKNYDFRHRVQPMVPPLHPTPSTSILLSSDEEAEILSRHPVRKGRSPHRKIGVAPDSAEDNEKPYSVVKSVAKYRVSLQEGNLLVRKLDKEAEKPTEAVTFKEDEEVKKVAEPIISDVEEEEIVTPPQVVVSATTAPPKWMHLNSAEFLFALLLTTLLFITYWCWNSDVC